MGKRFLVNRKNGRNAKFASTYDIIQAKSQSEAIKKAKNDFINTWLWGKKDAIEYIKKHDIIWYVDK